MRPKESTNPVMRAPVGVIAATRVAMMVLREELEIRRRTVDMIMGREKRKGKADRRVRMPTRRCRRLREVGAVVMVGRM